MSHFSRFGFIGGGRITRLLLQALKQKNALPDRVVIADPDQGMKAQVKAIDPAVIECVDNNTDVTGVDLLFLAVHPPVMKEVAAEIAGIISGNTIVVSLIPVISKQKLSGMLGGVSKLVRMIPNAPSLIHQGHNPVVFSAGITGEEKKRLQAVFANWGAAPEVDEPKLEAYAIVTAMGPTYFWPQWQKLNELGSKFGMSETELAEGMPAMLQGAVDLMFRSDLSPEQVMDLIPVYPMKQHEPDLLARMDESLIALHQKLTGTAK